MREEESTVELIVTINALPEGVSTYCPPPSSVPSAKMLTSVDVIPICAPLIKSMYANVNTTLSRNLGWLAGSNMSTFAVLWIVSTETSRCALL